MLGPELACSNTFDTIVAEILNESITSVYDIVPVSGSNRSSVAVTFP